MVIAEINEELGRSDGAQLRAAGGDATFVRMDCACSADVPALAALAHAREKMYFFHCCGKGDVLMDHLIDVVRIDAKHSFEDVVGPVTEAKRRWGSRVAPRGGREVDFVARSDEAALRRRVRETLDVCQPGGGYCLGLGNGVTDYIPTDNYPAVLDEGRRYLLQ